MAREYAQNRIAMWNDDDFRLLSAGAQNLYSYLLAHPTTSYAGVADWRPQRLQSVNSTWTAAEVRDLGEELSQALFIVIDEDTEEVCIRSFLRHESMLRNPNLTRAVVKAFNKIDSRKLRAVIAFEVNRLRDEGHDWAGFDVDDMYDIYENETLDGKTLGAHEGASSDPSSDRSTDPSSEASLENGTVWPITDNKQHVTGNQETHNNQLDSPAVPDGDESESVEDICRRQLRDVLHVDYVKTQVQLSKSCGRIPTPSDVVRVAAGILADAAVPPKNPTTYVIASIKNDWPRFQKLMDEAA